MEIQLRYILYQLIAVSEILPWGGIPLLIALIICNSTQITDDIRTTAAPNVG
jgi:hypothetical protein